MELGACGLDSWTHNPTTLPHAAGFMNIYVLTKTELHLCLLGDFAI